MTSPNESAGAFGVRATCASEERVDGGGTVVVEIGAVDRVEERELGGAEQREESHRADGSRVASVISVESCSAARSIASGSSGSTTASRTSESSRMAMRSAVPSPSATSQPQQLRRARRARASTPAWPLVRGSRPIASRSSTDRFRVASISAATAACSSAKRRSAMIGTLTTPGRASGASRSSSVRDDASVDARSRRSRRRWCGRSTARRPPAPPPCRLHRGARRFESRANRRPGRTARVTTARRQRAGRARSSRLARVAVRGRRRWRAVPDWRRARPHPPGRRVRSAPRRHRLGCPRRGERAHDEIAVDGGHANSVAVERNDRARFGPRGVRRGRVPRSTT